MQGRVCAGIIRRIVTKHGAFIQELRKRRTEDGTRDTTTRTVVMTKKKKEEKKKKKRRKKFEMTRWDPLAPATQLVRDKGKE